MKDIDNIRIYESNEEYFHHELFNIPEKKGEKRGHIVIDKVYKYRVFFTVLQSDNSIGDMINKSFCLNERDIIVKYTVQENKKKWYSFLPFDISDETIEGKKFSTDIKDILVSLLNKVRTIHNNDMVWVYK